MTPDTETQALLRRIVLRKERRATSGSLKEGQPVKGGIGTYPFGGKNGSKKEDKKDDDDEDDKKKPKRPDEPPMNPKDIPKNGDDARGIGPFYPCDGPGNCVNVRLDGMVPPPDGWEDACTPPPKTGKAEDELEQDEYGIIDKERYYRYELMLGDKVKKGVARRPQHIAKLMRSFFKEDYVDSWGTYGYDKSGRWAMQYAYDSYMNGQWGGYSGHACIAPCDSAQYWSANVLTTTCKEQPEPLMCDDNAVNSQWPKNRCSEVIATEEGFKPACDDRSIDPNLPPNMLGEYTAFELCDENGNRVRFSRDELRGGWNIDHPDYEAHINSDFRVQGVRRKPKK